MDILATDEAVSSHQYRERHRFETIMSITADEGMLLGNNDSDSSDFYGMTSVWGRRPYMEDAVAIHPSFFQGSCEIQNPLDFYGVYDGHGCSHVAMKCKDRMHEIVKQELEMDGNQRSCQEILKQSFFHMDEEITEWSNTSNVTSSPCHCELQTNVVGSTAIVAVISRDKIMVSNCGDSRAVLCRNGTVIPLSVDHKPDRPDEAARIQAGGGRIIRWSGDVARVSGILAMSRAIGDNYLKPFVISEPEVTITDRSSDDTCLIIATDGLWDVVSNENAGGVAEMCLKSHTSQSRSLTTTGENSNNACSDASILLTKLAFTRKSADNISVLVVDLRRNV